MYTDKVTPDIRQSKTVILSTNVNQKSIDIEFLIAIVAPKATMATENTVYSVF